MPEEQTANNLPQEAAEAPAQAEPKAENTTKAVEPSPRIDEPPDPASVKAEIEALEQRRKKAEEDAIYWRKQKAEARADYFKGRDEPLQQVQPQPSTGSEPKPADFPDYDQYVAAIADHRVKAARAEWERDQARREQEKQSQERAQNLQTKLQEGYKKYNDFEEVVFDRTAIHITPMVVDILSECDHPSDVAYYLAKNRVEGVAISRMTPIKAARAIAQLEAKLVNGSANSQSPPLPEKKPSTGAPPPITPLGSGGSGVTTKDPDKMTQKEYEKWRLSQGARRF